MKKLIVTILIAFAALAPMHLDNEYLRTDTFAAVTIQPGESLHDVAGRYTINETDKLKLIEAICDINDVHADAPLKAGRQLQIPVLAGADGSAASRAIAQK